MKRLLQVILLILLLAASSLAAYQHVQNSNLIDENKQLKLQLAEQVKRLQLVEGQLTEQQNNVLRLQEEIAQDRSNITRLQGEVAELNEELGKGQIALGLTFLWNPETNVNRTFLSQLIDWMNNVEWHELRVRFFIYHAEARDFMPMSEDCGENRSQMPWAIKAWNLYYGRDIPVGIVADAGHLGQGYYEGCAILKAPIFFMVLRSGVGNLRHTATVLSHELLHVFWFDEQQIKQGVSLTSEGDLVIPLGWSEQIQYVAEMFDVGTWFKTSTV